MGRRSRKRSSASARPARPPVQPAAARDPAPPRRRRPRLEEAPKAPWAPFPLVELVILIALVMIVAGFITHGNRGKLLLGCGLALVTLSSLEVSIREHFAGYRSHTSLLAGAAAVAVDVPLYFLTPVPQIVLLVAGVAVFGGAWQVLRSAFARRTGGMGFRA